MPQRRSGLHIPAPTKPRLTEEQAVAVRSALKADLAASYHRIHARSMDLPTFIMQRFGGRRMQLAAPIERRLPWVGERMTFMILNKPEHLPWRWSEKVEAARLIARLASGAA